MLGRIGQFDLIRSTNNNLSERVHNLNFGLGVSFGIRGKLWKMELDRFLGGPSVVPSVGFDPSMRRSLASRPPVPSVNPSCFRNGSGAHKGGVWPEHLNPGLRNLLKIRICWIVWIFWKNEKIESIRPHGFSEALGPAVVFGKMEKFKAWLQKASKTLKIADIDESQRPCLKSQNEKRRAGGGDPPWGSQSAATRRIGA